MKTSMRFMTALMVSALGCGENSDATTDTETESSVDTASGGTDSLSDDPCGTNDPVVADGDAAQLFGTSAVPVFDIHLPQEVWEELQVNARDEEYVEATVCFNGKSVGRAGLRFKGSYGSLLNCFNDAGENTCRKLGMKLKFNEYDPDNRFFGMKRLNFHGYRYDDSYIKEKLSYDLYRAMDITAPRSSWAALRVNGELQGLFGMVEEVDGRFTADRWPQNGDQNLYKEAWPGTTDTDWIVGHLKTNEEVADVEAFVAFSEALNAAAESDLRQTLAGYTDIRYLSRYMAVDDAIADFDGITTWYSAEDVSLAGNHNFYFYEAAMNNFVLIPWDKESTMSLNSGFGNVPHWTQTVDDCSVLYPVWRGENQVIAPSCDPVFRAIAQNLDDYRSAVQELLDGPFAVDAMEAKIDAHVAMIAQAVADDPNGPGQEKWEQAVAFIKKDLPGLRERLRLLAAGETWIPLEIDPAGVTDFENQDDFGLIMGTQMMCNATSDVAATINGTNAMGGAQDLKLSFEYANDSKPWNQWLTYNVPISGPAVDVSEMEGIRMTLRADEDRTLRFDITSPFNTAMDEGIYFGWDIPVSTTTTVVEVRFADAAMPGWAVSNGSAPDDELHHILTAIAGVRFFPQCNGRDAGGQLPEGLTDKGFLRIDDIVFF